MTDTKQHTDPQATDLTTGERLASTGAAVVQGAAHEASGSHETLKGKNFRLTDLETREIIDKWPTPQKNIAEQMIEKYGPPNEATPTKLFWYDNHPWKRTKIDADPVAHNWPTVHSDFLTQTIDYKVPPEMFHLIALFDGSIICDRTRGEVSARCDSESANVLGLNMVHEIVTGKRTYEEARHVSEQNTVAYNLGRNAPYAERLLFDIPNGGTEDLDEGHVAGAVIQQAAGKIKDLVTGSEDEPVERLTGRGHAG